MFGLWLDSTKLELALFGAKSRDSASAAQIVKLQGHDFLKCPRGHEFMKDHTILTFTTYTASICI